MRAAGPLRLLLQAFMRRQFAVNSVIR